MELKRFDKFDWDALAGAEPFADGSDPFVGHGTNSEDADFTVVVDANGIQVIFYDDTVMNFNCSPVIARFIGQGLDSFHVTPDSLKALGFEKLN